ncbi:DUF3995 domain-containing protein [Haloechinothrix halophila]|uniref:DUF3995 domain-containing protein n=1 Tax=Haloechinothrix halophila TaxID=1069073 RepID=UPI000686355B|nr:DUF3995 domain-containing protein [Haloechinothrix halophila]
MTATSASDHAAHRHVGGSMRLRLLASLCASWMIIFAAVHVYWAMGGPVGLPDGFSITEHPLLLVVDIVAVPLCLAGALLALALVRPIGRRYRRTVTWLTALTGVLAIVHAADTIVTDIKMLFGAADVPTSQADRLSAFLFEPWWLLGGIFFILAASTFNAEQRKAR